MFKIKEVQSRKNLQGIFLVLSFNAPPRLFAALTINKLGALGTPCHSPIFPFFQNIYLTLFLPFKYMHFYLKNYHSVFTVPKMQIQALNFIRIFIHRRLLN